jgi:polysaccharide biosynthesis protein PslG
MRRRLRSPVLACVLALCGLAAVAPASGAQGAPRARSSAVAPLGGVNVIGLSYGSRPAEADRAIAVARKLRAKVVRTELLWAVMEPRGPGQIDPKALAFTDRLMADAAAAGIKVIATARGTPCWDSSAPAPLLAKCSPEQFSAANRWPPSDVAAYGAFVAFLAKRYGPKLAAIEIWNEPDQANELYFAGPNKAKLYATLLRAAFPAIKQADPNVRVLGGSLVGSSGVFLRLLYADGIKGFYDALAVHFYTLTVAALRTFRQVQLENGDSKPLWLDELGWTSCWPHRRIEQEQACVTEGVQAANMRDIFRSLARVSYVGAELIYTLQDSPHEEFGVVAVRGRHKRAYSALAGVLASPFGPTSPVRLSLRRDGGRVVASGSAPVGDFMSMEVLRGGVLRYHAVFTLDRFNRYAISLPRVLGTSGLEVRVYQFQAGPGNAAQKRI